MLGGARRRAPVARRRRAGGAMDAGGLLARDLAFADNPLVVVLDALDPILVVAALFRQARLDPVEPAPIALVRAGREADRLTDLELVRHVEPHVSADWRRLRGHS